MEYDINKPENQEQNNIDFEPQSEEPEPHYWKAFLAGAIACIVVACILAIIGIWRETEYWWALIIGASVVAFAIKLYVPHQSVGGALIGAILCPLTYVIYQYIMSLFGYSYESDGAATFGIILIVSVVVGAWLGYNDFDEGSLE